MTNVEKIKDKIQQLKKESANKLGKAFVEGDANNTMSNGGAVWVCEQLLSFIDSLEPDLCIRKIDDFNVGDIIYVYGNEDYYPAIIRLPEDFKNKGYFKCDMLIIKDKENDMVTGESIDVYDSMMCRLATKDEINLFLKNFDVK